MCAVNVDYLDFGDQVGYTRFMVSGVTGSGVTGSGVTVCCGGVTLLSLISKFRGFLLHLIHKLKYFRSIGY